MKTVVIFGGSGFVGRHIIRRIAKIGYKIIIPYQHNINESELRFFGNTGQIIPIRFRSISEKIILNQLKSADVIINLKTLWDEKRITYEKGIFGFNKILCDYIKNNNKNCQLIYFSGIAIDGENKSKRIRAIVKSEEYFQKNLYNSIIIRPGVMIGGNDQFLKNLLPIFKMSLFVPLLGKGEAKFQPVYVDDVSKAILKIIDKSIKGQNLFELVGTHIFSYREFYKIISSCFEKQRYLIPIPMLLIKIIVFFLQKTPFSPLNLEQLKLFETDNIANNLSKNLTDLEIYPQDLFEITRKIIKKNL